MKAIYIGRFQPFHKGHMHAIKKALEKFDELVIGIGSSNESHTRRNPFSFEERKEMMQRAGVNCKIIAIPDCGDNEKWVKQILDMENFDVVISGSDWVKECFSGKKEVIEPDRLRFEEYNGTKIRRRMERGEKWDHLVPEEVAEYIKSIKGEERVRSLK